MSLKVETVLRDFVDAQPDFISKRFVIAYSGGCDSHVLLHTVAVLKAQSPVLFPSLKAIHINHQIHPNSAQWAQHCVEVARNLEIPCQVININLNLKKGESLEAKAREARYQAIQSCLEENDILLTAHTQDDQAETLLLQLLRGAGVQGLSAMGVCKVFGCTYHYRPLLSITRENIETASRFYNLSWITDDSNENLRFDRNFIRHQILPLLKTRFNGVVSTLSRSAQLCQEAAKLQEIQAESDFNEICVSDSNQINQVKFIALSFERQKAVIRYWIFKNNKPYPSKLKLEEMVRQMNNTRLDASPSIEWKRNVIRRYKQNWYLSDFSLTKTNPLNFTLEKVQGSGYKLAIINNINELSIKYRQGGERCKPAGQPFSKSLKKWFQIFEIPPWLRDQVPLIYYQQILIGVVGYFICEGWQVEEEKEWGVIVRFLSSDPIISC